MRNGLSRKNKRRADSTSSDMVCPLLADSWRSSCITESSIFRVVFIWETIQEIWMYVKGKNNSELKAES